MSYLSEKGHIQKVDGSISYNAECISCGETDKLELWPHRNGHGGMIGFVFLCQGCKSFASGISMDIHGIRGEDTNPE